MAPLAVLGAVLAGPVLADYSGNAKTPALLDTLKTQYAFSATDLDSVRGALHQAQLLPQLIHSEQTSKEKTLTWEDYKPLRVTPAHIENGLRFLQEQKPWLDKPQKQFGVPPEVLLLSRY